ncbi:hypothetical protein FKM82_019068 [Ascaphus truei]
MHSCRSFLSSSLGWWPYSNQYPIFSVTSLLSSDSLIALPIHSRNSIPHPPFFNPTMACACCVRLQNSYFFPA